MKNLNDRKELAGSKTTTVYEIMIIAVNIDLSTCCIKEGSLGLCFEKCTLS